MRKIIHLLVVLSLGTTLQAQRFDIGLEVGGNIIPVSTSELSQNFGLGINSGFKMQYQLKNNFYLSAGLGLSQRKKFQQTTETESLTSTLNQFLSLLGGSDFLDIDSLVNSLGVNMDVNTTKSAIITMNHVELPVLFTYQYKKVQIHLGGYASAMFGAKRNVEEKTEVPFLQAFNISQFDTTGIAKLFLPPAEEIETETNNETSDLNPFDYGVMAGVSYKTDHMLFSVYYSQGLADYRFQNTEPEKDYHSSIRCSVGYLINIKKEDGKIIIQ